MRGLSAFISALVTAALAGLLVVVFQGPLARQFSPDRLKAEVTAGRWAPIFRDGTSPATEVERNLGGYAAKRFSEGDGPYYARIVVTNAGAKRVENIRIDWIVLEASRVAVLQNDRWTFPPAQKSLELPAMPPGGRLELHVWSVLDIANEYAYDKDNLKSFTSEGPITFELQSYSPLVPNDPFKLLIDDWVGPGLILILVTLSTVGVGATIFINSYIKLLLSDVNYYRRERMRYVADPKKFVANYPPQKQAGSP